MDRNAMPRLIVKCYPVNKLGIEGKRYNKRINTWYDNERELISSFFKVVVILLNDQNKTYNNGKYWDPIYRYLTDVDPTMITTQAF